MSFVYFLFRNFSSCCKALVFTLPLLIRRALVILLLFSINFDGVILKLTAEEASSINDSSLSTKTLILTDALAMAITGSPLLEEFSWNLRASEARKLQAGLLTNPEFNYQLENIGGTGSFNGTAGSQATYMLYQLVELGGKRSIRKEIATLDSDIKKINYERKRNEILGEVTNKFYLVAGNQELLKLAKEEVNFTANTLKNITQRVNAGKSSRVEEKKAQILLSQIQIKEEHIEHELASAKLRLATTWGAERVLFKNVRNDIFIRKPLPSFESLLEKIKDNPELKEIILLKQMAQTEVKLAKAGRIPDVTVGAGFREIKETNDETFVVQFSMPLPIFDRNQHQISEKMALQSRIRTIEKSTKLQSNEVVFALYQELAHADLELDLNEKKIIRQAEEALKIANEGFKRGSYSYLELSDVQRLFFEAKQKYIQAALDYHRLVVEMEILIGASISDEIKKLTKNGE